MTSPEPLFDADAVAHTASELTDDELGRAVDTFDDTSGDRPEHSWWASLVEALVEQLLAEREHRKRRAVEFAATVLHGYAVDADVDEPPLPMPPTDGAALTYDPEQGRYIGGDAA